MFHLIYTEHVISDGQITNQITVSNQKSFDKKI